jgi:isocitrate lyase
MGFIITNDLKNTSSSFYPRVLSPALNWPPLSRAHCTSRAVAGARRKSRGKKDVSVAMADQSPPSTDPWGASPRWRGVRRDYTAADVDRLRPTLPVEHTIARHGAERLWQLLHEQDYVAALGALTGGQAVQMVRAGLQAVYLSGWQVAADANLAGQVYPDQSLYPANSVPAVVRRVNNALQRADQVDRIEGRTGRSWLVPVVADAEAGFGGALNAFELTLAMIEAGAAGVHFEDQLASEKKCGHLGGKVLVPTAQFVRTLTAARLAADVAGVPTVLVARTDALAATLLTSDVDERDQAFATGGRTAEGYHVVRGGLESATARALAYAPYADLLWCETSTPDLDQARRFAEAVHAEFPGKPLAYNCSPSFNWRRHLDDATIATFQKELGAMGYRFQFLTLAGFHALNAAMFELASGYREQGMSAYVRLQERELAMEAAGYSATRHQREVGTGYFDAVAGVISAGTASTLALAGSTEQEQFRATS